MKKRKKMRLQMEKCYAKSRKHLSKTERWTLKLLLLKLKYPKLNWLKIIVKFALSIISPGSRPGLLMNIFYESYVLSFE